MHDLLLLSGGVDSIALACWKRPAVCLTVDYGQQPAIAEIAAATAVCEALSLEHIVLKVPVSSLGSGVMAGSAVSNVSEHAEFWPFRNQFLITVGAMYALKRDLRKILIGTVSTDNRHADGSDSFVRAMSSLLLLQEGSLQLDAPALYLSTQELYSLSGAKADVITWAHSCHTGDVACNWCPGCVKHSAFMQSIGHDR